MTGFGNVFRGIQRIMQGITELPRKARHAVVIPIVKVERLFGRSYNQITNDLQTLRLVPKNSPFSRDVEAYIHAAEHEQALRELPHDAMPNFDMITEFDFGRIEHYKWIIRVYAREPYSLTYTWRFISIYTDYLMPADQLISQLGFYSNLEASPYLTHVKDYEVWVIQHLPGAPYGAL